jgi:hypothetical protein
MRPAPARDGPHAQVLSSLRRVNRAIGENAQTQSRDRRSARPSAISAASARRMSLTVEGFAHAGELLHRMHR